MRNSLNKFLEPRLNLANSAQKLAGSKHVYMPKAQMGRRAGSIPHAKDKGKDYAVIYAQDHAFAKTIKEAVATLDETRLPGLAKMSPSSLFVCA